MDIKFNNNSRINTLDYTGNMRGERSNFVEGNCYDLETGNWVFMTIDLRKPIDRFIPEYLYHKAMKG